MATRPELHIAVAKQKSKASEYNDNFDMMMDYVDDSIQESKDYVDGFMPDVTGQSGKFLTNDGTSTSWASVFSGNQSFTGNNTFSGTNEFTGNVTISGSSFNFTKCTTKPTTTSTASTSKVSVVVKNYLNGNSGYVKYSDGLIIQWGQNTTASQEAKISLLTSFTTTTYFVALQLVNKRQSSQQNISPYDKSTSSFYRTCNGGTEYNNPIAWIAIGY